MPPAIFTRHQQVLTAWAELRQCLNEAPRLITLDHHTDTSLPFRTWFNSTQLTNCAQTESLRHKWLTEVDYQNPESLVSVIAKLSNDEHILTALSTGMISDALVIAHDAQNTDLTTYQQHAIICRSVDRPPYCKNVSRELCDRVIESDFLNDCLRGFAQLLEQAEQPSLLCKPYILDIDLDYFNTRQSLRPTDAGTFLKLIHNAQLVTIATEPDYVAHCSLDSQLSSEEILKVILKFYEQSLSP